MSVNVSVVWFLLSLSSVIYAEQSSLGRGCQKGVKKRNLFERFFGSFPTRDYNATSYPLYNDLAYHPVGYGDPVFDNPPIRILTTTENPHKKVTLMQVEKENEESMMRQLTENKYKNSLPVVIFDPFRYPITFRSPSFCRFKKAHTGNKVISPKYALEIPCKRLGSLQCYKRKSLADEVSPMPKLTKRDRQRVQALASSSLSEYSPHRTRNVWKLEGTQCSERGKAWGQGWDEKLCRYDSINLSDQERMYNSAEEKLNRLYQKAANLFSKSNDSLIFIKEFEGMTKRDTPATPPSSSMKDKAISYDSDTAVLTTKKVRKVIGRKKAPPRRKREPPLRFLRSYAV